MPVKYFAPNVTVKLCIIDFFLLEITVVKKWTIWMFAPPTAIYTHGSGLSKYYFYAIPRSLLDIVNRCKSHMPMIYLPPPAAAIICMIWHKNTVHAYCKPSLYLLSNYSFLPNNKNCIWVFELLSSIMFVYFMYISEKRSDAQIFWGMFSRTYLLSHSST